MFEVYIAKTVKKGSDHFLKLTDKLVRIPLLLVFVCMLMIPMPAYAVTSAEKQAEADQAKAQLSDLMGQLEIASDNYYTALAEHDSAVSAMDEAQARIDSNEAQITKLQSHLSVRAASMYKEGPDTFVDFLLGASSFSDFVNTWDFLNQMNEADADCVKQVKALQEETQAARDDYAALAQIAADKVAEAEVAQAVMQKSVDAYQTTVANLDAEVSALIAAEQAAQVEASRKAAQDALDRGPKLGPGSGGGNSGNNEIVALAYSKVGCEYTMEQGRRTGPDSFDCSGLTQWCYAQVGISIPGTSIMQYDGMQHIALSDAQPGDVLWRPKHVAIYAGDNTYVHASDYGVGVIVSTGIGGFSCALRPY